MILRENKRGEVILLAGETYGSLPVTAAVQTALRLAEAGYKTLLTDMDSRRCALARAFEVEPEQVFAGPVETCVEGIYVVSQKEIEVYTAEAIAYFLNTARAGMDAVILYAPNLGTAGNVMHLTRAAQRAIVFTDKRTGTNPVYDLLADSPCEVMEILPSPKEALRD